MSVITHRENNYCKLSDTEVSEAMRAFMQEKSKLPSVSVSEITGHGVSDSMFEDFVPERRRWLELTAALKREGWSSRRMRAFYFEPDGSHSGKVTMRWFPPTKKEA